MVGAAAGTAGMSTVWMVRLTASSRSIGVIPATRQTGGDNAVEVQGDEFGRPRGEFHRVLSRCHCGPKAKQSIV